MQHIAVAVLSNERGEVLVTRRARHVHQGGRWEFPGGKVEAGENLLQALARELDEELGVTLRAARPLIRIPHSYPDAEVLLDVWRVTAYAGAPWGREGQAIEWVSAGALAARDLPAADLPIVTAVRLPGLYLITPEPGPDEDAFLERLAEAMRAGVELVQFRAKGLRPERFLALAARTIEVGARYGARILVNGPVEVARDLGAHGVHLSSARLMRLVHRPARWEGWVAASCHDAGDLAHACRIGVDFAVAGPVMATASHPEAPPLGWEGLRSLTERATVPVYALGGLAPRDCATAWRYGAQGVAAIRSLWNAPDIARSVAACE